jgi:hypothetical protein
MEASPRRSEDEVLKEINVYDRNLNYVAGVEMGFITFV